MSQVVKLEITFSKCDSGNSVEIHSCKSEEDAKDKIHYYIETCTIGFRYIKFVVKFYNELPCGLLFLSHQNEYLA